MLFGLTWVIRKKIAPTIYLYNITDSDCFMSIISFLTWNDSPFAQLTIMIFTTVHTTFHQYAEFFTRMHTK